MKPGRYSRTISADKYFDIVNFLSGQAQEMIVELLDFIFDDEENIDRKKQKLRLLYKLILGCDDPRPVLRELWKYKLWKMDPLTSLTFKEFCFMYIPSSISLNFQLEDSDLSRKALMVGNVAKAKKTWDDIV